MSEPDLLNRADFYSGGFFLIRSRQHDWEPPDQALLPDKLLNLSQHMGYHFDPVWIWTPPDPQSLHQFGISDTHWQNVTTYCTQAFDQKIGFGGIFPTIQTAQDFVRRFLPDTLDLYVIEIGLPVSQATLITADSQVNLSIASRIHQQIALSRTGEVLGFEVVGYEHDALQCSWLCSYLHRDMFTHYNIKANKYGLLKNLDDAQTVYQWIADDKMQGRRAEPMPYYVWLVLSHPIRQR